MQVRCLSDLVAPTRVAAGPVIIVTRRRRRATHVGLVNAVALLKPVKDANPDVSWADIFQMGSALGVEVQSL